MAKFILISASICLSFALANCGNLTSIPEIASIDTLFRPNEVVVKHHYGLDTLNQLSILETSTLMITDSMLEEREFQILRQSVKNMIRSIS